MPTLGRECATEAEAIIEEPTKQDLFKKRPLILNDHLDTYPAGDWGATGSIYVPRT